jgi:hypothetical protein
MTAKDYLNRAFILNNRINDKLIKLECYRDLSSSVSSPSFEEKFSGTRNIEPPFVRYLGKISDLEDEIKADYERLEEIKNEIDAEIDKLEDPYEQLILRYRYLMFMTMPQIATKVHYTLRWTQRIHNRGLENFERVHGSSPQFTPSSSVSRT